MLSSFFFLWVTFSLTLFSYSRFLLLLHPFQRVYLNCFNIITVFVLGLNLRMRQLCDWLSQLCEHLNTDPSTFWSTSILVLVAPSSVFAILVNVDSFADKLLSLFQEPEYNFRVPRENFFPRPKVCFTFLCFNQLHIICTI